MEKKKSAPRHPHDTRHEETPLSPVANLLKLGGLVYCHDLHDVQPDLEGANLLDLQARQSSVPLLSTKTETMIGCFRNLYVPAKQEE